jgi:ribosomal protein L30E
MKAEIRKLLGSDKLVIGAERVCKLLRDGKLARVLVASNCDGSVLDDVTRYAGLAGTELVRLEVDNEELGVYCKKPFNIMLLGIRA